MTDPSFDELVGAALAQAPEIAALDAVRAEAWASDLLALAAELGDESGDALLARLRGEPGDAGEVARHALSGFRPEAAAGLGSGPPWAGHIGTSRCDGAWVLRARGAASALFGFVDASEARHVVSVDLVPGAEGRPEQVGEVAVGPAGLLDALTEDDAKVDVDEAPAAPLAARVAAALAATLSPTPSAVANGALLVARLGLLVEDPPPPPRAVPEAIPEVPERDAGDDAWALDLLRRSLDRVAPVAEATDGLDAAIAALDHPAVEAWSHAATGEATPDLAGVARVLAAAVAPADLAPLAPADRDAVLALESADWLGAVIELVRAGPGAAADGAALVDAVNRCAEVGSTIPKGDRDRIAWAFDRVVTLWEAVGVTAAGTLTPLGAAALPAAMDWAWSPTP